MVQRIVLRIAVLLVLCTLTATSLEENGEKVLALKESDDIKKSDRQVLKVISSRNLANFQDNNGDRKLTFFNPFRNFRTRFGNIFGLPLFGGNRIFPNFIFPGGVSFGGARFNAGSNSFTAGNGFASGNAFAGFGGASATSTASSFGNGVASSNSFASAVIFDAKNPTGEGNFIGGRRTSTLGNVLIVNKNENFTVPDTNKDGGVLVASFQVPVTLRAFRVVNVLKRGGFIEVFGDNNTNLLQNKTLPFTGKDRSRYVWFQQQEGVKGFAVVSPGSFAIDDVIFFGPEVILEEEEAEEETESLMF